MGIFTGIFVYALRCWEYEQHLLLGNLLDDYHGKAVGLDVHGRDCVYSTGNYSLFCSAMVKHLYINFPGWACSGYSSFPYNPGLVGDLCHGHVIPYIPRPRCRSWGFRHWLIAVRDKSAKNHGSICRRGILWYLPRERNRRIINQLNKR